MDVRVGKFHVLQLLIHLRKRDWKWYQTNAQGISEEFQELLQERVLPRMVGKELEEFVRAKHPGVFAPLPEQEYTNSKVTAKYKVKKQDKASGSHIGRVKAEGKGGTTVVAKPRSNKNSKIRKASMEIVESLEKPEKSVCFSFGDIIQLSYRREPAFSYTTVFFPSNQAGDINNSIPSRNNIPFTNYRKLSCRLLIWVSKLDQEQKTNPDPEGVGFYRPEMIPIPNLFRRPAELDLPVGEIDDE
jgi:hypothetical protein